MCVSCGTVMLCDCTRMQTGTENWKSVAAASYKAGRADGMREAAVVVAHEGADIAASLAGEHGPCDKTAAAVTLNVADAILSAIGEKP